MPEVQHPMRGVALILMAFLLFAVLDASSKHLAKTFAVPLLVWARYSVHCLLMVIFLAPSMGARLLITRRPLAQVLRSLLLVGMTGFMMAAFRLMPLAETTSLLFITPLFVTIMAGPLLKEKVSLGRWLAAFAGFAGALIIARPGGGLSTAGALLVLGAALCYSAYQILTRQMSVSENTITMLFYTALTGTVIMTLFLPWFWHGLRLDPSEALLFVSLGVSGGIGQYLMTAAFRHAPASTLSPLMYGQIIWATLLGWQVFGQVPDSLSILGIAIIVGSGLVIILGERRNNSRHA